MTFKDEAEALSWLMKRCTANSGGMDKNLDTAFRMAKGSGWHSLGERLPLCRAAVYAYGGYKQSGMVAKWGIRASSTSRRKSIQIKLESNHNGECNKG